MKSLSGMAGGSGRAAVLAILMTVGVCNSAEADGHALELLARTLEQHQRESTVTEWVELSVQGAIPFRGTQAVYFVVGERPADGVVRFPRLNNQVRTAVFLTNEGESTTPVTSQLPPHYRRNEVCELTQSPTDWMLTIPDSRACPLVIALDLIGEPIYSPDPHVETPSADGTVVLSAHHAVVHGEKLQYEPLPHKNTVGYWANPDDWVEWRFEAPPGAYHVELLQGCGQGQAGSRVRMQVDGAVIDFDVEETGHFQNFRWRDMGQVELSGDEVHSLSLRVVELAEFAVMDVRQIRLVPVEAIATDLVEQVQPDLVLPPLLDGPPAAGRRVLHTLPQSPPAVYHTVYLPTDWREDQDYPVLVELTGNGPYKNPLGDVCTGRPEDAELALGLSGGDGWILVSLPFLNADGTAPVAEWWGDPPDYEVTATLDYWHGALDDICDHHGGDPDCIVLAGFSRGSIACNYLGLHDDSISARWKGFVCNSHYDGLLEEWPYPDCDREAALGRLHRLAGRPQLILSETSDEPGTSLDAVRKYLADSNEAGQWTFASTGFRNHSDDWALRPSPAREQVRQWLSELVEYQMHPR